MPRPSKDGFDYFPFDTDFFHNSEKIETLIARHGAVGVAAYINILCRVYADGYYIKIRDFDSFARSIAKDIMSDHDQLKHMTAKVAEALHCMIETGLLDGALLDMNLVSGRSLQARFADMVKRAKRNTKMDIHVLEGVNIVAPKNGVNSEKTQVSSEKTQVSSEEGTQSKVKEKTTTTCYGMVSASGSEDFPQAVENSPPTPPTLTEIRLYMQTHTQLDDDEAQVEAVGFFAHNTKRNWDCLPCWQEYVDVWVSKMRR